MSSPSGSLLTLKHVFGLKGDVKDNIAYIDESTLVYPAGYNVVVYNSEKKTQRFLPLTPPQQSGEQATSGDISAMAICHTSVTSTAAATGGKTGVIGSEGRNRGKLLAVADRVDGGRACVSVFDLSSFKRRGKSGLPLSCGEVASSEFVSCAFSPDGKYLLTQGGGPDWTLVNWSWEKGKPMQIAKVSNQSGATIHQVSFCPTDPSVVCVTGNGILRFLHIEQNEFKSIPFSMGKREPQNYLSHCWVDDRILVGTDNGDILVFENAEFRGVLESSPAGGKSIDCIAAYSKGFVIGMDEGYIMTFERDEKEIYKFSKSFQIDGNFVRVTSLAISPSEEHVVATLENNQAYLLSLSPHHHPSELMKSGSAGNATSTNGDSSVSGEMNFEPLAMPFHHMSITGLDVCIRKPLVVTCGMDRSVRIWNYLNRTVEVTRFFNEQPHSVAFHPSGLHLLVGFSDSLRMLNILMDDVVPFRDFAIKGCKECQFSNGGQYFAAANGSIIQVFATYTCEMLGSFNVHKAKVRSIAWLPDDSAILSAGMDGCVFITRIKTGEHVACAKHKCNYTSAVTTSDGKIYAVGSDRHLKVIQESTLQAELNCGVILTQLTTQMPRPPLKDRFLFAGTETGVVRVFPIPVEGKCYDQQVHTGMVTRLRCSPDDNYLFTVGEDGCFAMFSIEQKRDAQSSNRASAATRLGTGVGGEGSSSSGHASMQWAEEILVNRGDLEEKLAILQDLQNRVTELMLHNETNLAIKEALYKDRLRETNEKFNQQLEADKQRYAALEEEKEELEKNYNLKVEQLNALQKSKLDELNSHHLFKMQQEEERYGEMEERISKQRAKWEADLAKLDADFAAEKQALIDEYESKIAEARQLRNQLNEERDSVRNEMDEATNLMETDADQELDEIKQAYDKKLTVERLSTLWLKDENAIFKRKFASLREDIAENLDELGRMKEKQSSLYDTIDTLEKDIKGHVKEIKERESTIADKRARIFELKKKNQELEKFKFVLDYKITELKRQIQPRKIEMKQLGEQIAEMEKELKQYRKESADLKLDVTELNLKYDGMESNIVKEAASRELVSHRLSHFKTELHEVYQDIEDPKKLKDGIKRLFQRHVQNAKQMEEVAERNRAKEKAAAAAMAQRAKAGSTTDLSSTLPLPPPLSASVSDVHHDYQRQRHYLERSIDSHNAKCKKDMRVHVKEHTRIMAENIALTKEVNELRREKYHILVSQKAKEANKKVGGAASASAAMAAISGSPSHVSAPSPSSNTASHHVEETEIQQEQIRALKKQLAMLEAEYQQISGGGQQSDSQHLPRTGPLTPHPPRPSSSTDNTQHSTHSARSSTTDKLPMLSQAMLDSAGKDAGEESKSQR